MTMSVCVIIIPDGVKDHANELGSLMGWGGGNYLVPLSADGSAPATHWATAATDPAPAFVPTLAAFKAGITPPELDGFAHTEAVRAALVFYDVASMEEALEAAGLERVNEPSA